MPTVNLNNLADSNFANALGIYLNPTPYFLGIVFIFLVIFFYGMKAGRGKTIITLLSLYIAVILTNLFPYQEQLIQNFNLAEPFLFKAGLFVIAIIVVFALLLRSPLKILALHERRKGSLFQILILSLLALGIFASYLTSILPEAELANLDHPIFKYFKTGDAQFWWALAGTAVLALMRKKGE